MGKILFVKFRKLLINPKSKEKMRTSRILMAAGLAAILFGACQKKADLKIQFPERFEGKTVELMNYKDSSLVATAVVEDGKAHFMTLDSDFTPLPQFMQLSVDGRICAYYIAEEGEAFVSDSTNVARGTPLNDRFADLLQRLDSIENLDDMGLYVDFAEKTYNANRDNPIGEFFGIEWLKFAEPERVDSMLSKADEGFRNSRRVRHYENFARHRLETSPGHKYVDFEGEDASGKPRKLSDLIAPGKYTIIDFWASWCPYCIKELPELKRIRADFGPTVEIVGVAVRDLPEDTRAMIKKQEIGWPVLFNTQKIPYDIYGFSGIPHHIFIAPDGTIISRGESAAQLRKRIEGLISDSKAHTTSGK